MKIFLPFLLLLSSCSLISVHEGPRPEQRRSTWIGVTTNQGENVRIRRNDISMFTETHSGECFLVTNSKETIVAEIDCKELELELQR
jgi:hypothetical protein